jgi:hypothetical protein
MFGCGPQDQVSAKPAGGEVTTQSSNVGSQTADDNTGQTPAAGNSDPDSGDPDSGDPDSGDPGSGDPDSGGNSGGTSELDPEANPASAGNGEVIDISFDDIILQIQADIAFRPWMLTARVKELDGKRIRISGYMLPDSKLKGIDQFVLLRNTECKYGPGGQADHLLNVTMRKKARIDYRSKPISIEGVIQVRPFQGPDGNTWSIYDLNEADNVTNVRRR